MSKRRRRSFVVKERVFLFVFVCEILNILKFHLTKLKDPSVLETFQAMIDGKFAPLTMMNNEDADMDSMITTFNKTVTETALSLIHI